MKTESLVDDLGIDLSNISKDGTGFLLSMDDVELIRNIASSLQDVKNIEFLNAVADKEFASVEEKEIMQKILKQAAKKIKQEFSHTS